MRSFVARDDGEHSRVVRGIGPLGYERYVLWGSSVAFAWGRIGLAQTIRGSLPWPVLHLSNDCANSYIFGRRRVEAAPGEATFVAPGWEFTRHSAPGSLFAIGVDDRALGSELAARRADLPRQWAHRSFRLQVTVDERVALQAAIAEFSAVVGPRTHPRVRKGCEERVIGVVAGILLRRESGTRVSKIAASRVASLEAWIDAHLDESITLGRLCEVAGVSGKTLQTAFATRRGVSPMRFVVERRLAAARHGLSHAGPETDVTAIATSFGFSHLGRFSVLYRQAYGEPPSRTLRR